MSGLVPTAVLPAAPDLAGWGGGPPAPEVTRLLRGPQARGVELARPARIFLDDGPRLRRRWFLGE